jgi:hypothetical protein
MGLINSTVDLDKPNLEKPEEGREAPEEGRIYYTTMDPDPKGRYQSHRSTKGMYAGDPPKGVTDEHYFYGVHFSAPLKEKTTLDLSAGDIRGVEKEDIEILMLTDALSGAPITVEEIAQFMKHYGLGVARKHCVQYLNDVVTAKAKARLR